VTRLHHLALGASDVESLALFYRDVLGLPEVERHFYDDGALRSVWLDLGGPLLMIEHTDEPPRRVEGVGFGLFLIALRVNIPDRAVTEQALRAAGAPIESRTTFTTYSRDPEGNRIALSHYPDSVDG
jgi:glyoxylase I family protein